VLPRRARALLSDEQVREIDGVRPPRAPWLGVDIDDVIEYVHKDLKVAAGLHDALPEVT